MGDGLAVTTSVNFLSRYDGGFHAGQLSLAGDRCIALREAWGTSDPGPQPHTAVRSDVVARRLALGRAGMAGRWSCRHTRLGRPRDRHLNGTAAAGSRTEMSGYAPCRTSG